VQRTVPLWLFLLFLVLGLLAVVAFGWAVQNFLSGGNRTKPYGKAIMAVATFPDLAKASLEQVASAISGGTQETAAGATGLVRDPKFTDTGYLLLSTFDSSNVTRVELMRLSDGRIMHQWMLSDAEARRIDPNKDMAPAGQPLFQPAHPLLLEDGSIIGANEGPLLKLDRCSRVQWAKRGTFHHAIEKSDDGTFWVSGVLTPSSFDASIYPELRDDSIVQISLDGEIIQERSVARMLVDNGHQALLFGVGAYDQDPVHLNETQPVLATAKHWQRGDVFLSSRHRSSVFLYRPSENRIVWLKTGPWMNQHDVEMVNDHTISVFGNDVVRLRPETLKVLPAPVNYTYVRGQSTVYLYDFDTDQISRPYDRILAKLKLGMIAAGRSKVLPNGDVYIDDAVGRRVFRTSPDQVRWTYTPDSTRANMNWSRYLSAEEVAPALPNLNCRSQ
jgi:hypothetical protein